MTMATDDPPGTDLFEVTCPHCEKTYHLTPTKVARHQGQRIRCKACEQVFIMPEAPEEPAAVEAARAPVMAAVPRAEPEEDEDDVEEPVAETTATRPAVDEDDLPGSTPWAYEQEETDEDVAAATTDLSTAAPVAGTNVEALRIEVLGLRQELRSVRRWNILAGLVLLWFFVLSVVPLLLVLVGGVGLAAFSSGFDAAGEQAEEAPAAENESSEEPDPIFDTTLRLRDE